MPSADVPAEVEARLPEHLQIENIRKIPGAPGKGKVGASGEYLQAIRDRKKALETLAPGEYGPPRKYSKREAEAIALDEMLPTAIKVLRRQLESKDEKVAQSAAVKVLEYVKGKPTQTVQQELHQVTKIVYESAAWRPGLEVVEGEYRELPPAPDA